MTTALLVIDAQESFRARPNWSLISNPDIVEDINRLVAHARSREELVVWILHSEPGSANVFDPESGHVRFLEGLKPEADEPQLVKTSINAFTTTRLQQMLTERGITKLRVCGIRTEQCCETTTRVGSDLGYAMTFVIDATATQPIEHRDATPGRELSEIMADPLTLQCQDILTRTEYALSGRFATISTVEEVIAGT